MNCEHPKVSIMIPTYNQDIYISKAIESALAQDYMNIEIIVSNDNSTDKTDEIIQKYVKDKRIHYIRNEQNLGRVGNYHNTLYKYTSGEWVINLDGDDYYTDNSFITKAMRSIQQAETIEAKIVAYCGKHTHLYKTKRLCRHTILDTHSLIVNGENYFQHYCEIGSFSHMNCLYKREVAISLDTYTKHYQASDFYSIMRIILTGDIILSDYIAGVWREHRDNTTTREADKKYSQAVDTFKDILEYASQYFDSYELKKWEKKACKRAYYDYISTLIHCRSAEKNKLIIPLIRCFRLKKSYFLLCFFFIINR